MTHPIADDAFDLSQIFIGRQQQLDLFDIYLHRWKNIIFAAEFDDPPITSAPTPNDKIQGFVTLLYGRGGFGKSTLLRRYRDMALQDGRNFIVSTPLDWEFAVEGKRGVFNPPPGQEMSAPDYFHILCGQLALALDKKPQDFREYQAAVKDIEKARKDADNVLDSMKKDDRYSWLRGLAVEAISTAVRTYVPGSSTIMSNTKVQAGVDEAAKFTQEQIAQIRRRLHDKLGNRMGDYLESALQLGLALGRDLQLFARNYPLLIFFDTYEEIDEGDRLLRIVVHAAGLRVGWVIAGRDNLWAGHEQRERSTAMEYGYKDLLPSDRGLSINFNAGDIGAFTLSDITEYFALLRKQAQQYLHLPRVTEEDAKRILDVTQGVPLAVKIAAGLYSETADLRTITDNIEGKREIIDGMVRRYLLHTRADESEKAKLYGLALLRRADQPDAVAAALGLTAEQAKTAYANELSLLQRRYSFIFTEKEQPSLHQEVRHFLRLWLLEHRKEPHIRALIEQLQAAHEEMLQHLEERIQYASLKERLQDDEWANIYLDLAEQQFWLDTAVGIRYILPFMIAAAIYQRGMNEDASEIGTFFAETQVRSLYHQWWQWAEQSLTYTTSQFPSEQELNGLRELTALSKERCPIFPQPLPAYREELEAALWWRMGEVYRGRDDATALEWYEKALSRLKDDSDLKQEIAKTCYDIGYKLYDEKKYSDVLPYLNRAIELKVDYTWAYNLRGIAYHNLKDYPHAISDYEQAILLDSSYADAYGNRGTAYFDLKDYPHAISDYEQAILLNPSYAHAYINRGNAYADLKDYPHAISDYEQAIQLNPSYAKAYNNRGLAYGNLKDYPHAISDYDQAIQLNPSYADAYIGRGIAYYSLKDYPRAISDYDQAIQLNPSDALAYNNRGLAYYSLKDYPRAIQDFNHAIELEPNFYWIHGALSFTCLWMKDTQQAISSYLRCYQLDPEDINSAWMAEWVGMGRLRPGIETAEQLEKIASIDLQSYLAYVCKGVASGLRGKLKEGLAELEQALTLDPDEWDALFWKGMLSAYYYSAHPQRASAAIEKALELDMPPILLTPLYWLQKDRPDFFRRYAQPLLEKCQV